MTTKQIAASGAAIAIIVGVIVAYAVFRPAPVPPPVLVPAPAKTTQPTANAPVPPATPPAECLLPGPPPVPPNGETATAADMKLGHDVMQAFVNQLEAYQNCRNAQIDRAAPSVTDAQKQHWLEQGNAAVDDANDLAAAFGRQLSAFKARKPGQ